MQTVGMITPRFTPQCVWDELKNSNLPVIIYGMGNGADKVLDEFNRRNIVCHGVMASDSFARYQSFRGFTVKKLSDFEKELGDFVVALCFASSIERVISDIRLVSKRHRLLVPCVPVVGSEIMDAQLILRNRDEINRAFELLCDERSKEVFIGAVNFQLSGELSYLDNITTQKSEAFSSILKLHNSESYLDLGAYRGDTVTEFLSVVNDYNSITAVEPDIKNYKKLVDATATLNRVNCINAGVADKCGSMFASFGGGRQSHLFDVPNTPDTPTAPSAKSHITQVVSVDSLYQSDRFTYIKADIEGMESLMLDGAKSALLSKPKLNIAAYHKCADIFELLLKIHEINPQYRFYLRKHPYIPCWDMNLYCV